jgi:hypothetical protein
MRVNPYTVGRRFAPPAARPLETEELEKQQNEHNPRGDSPAAR